MFVIVLMKDVSEDYNKKEHISIKRRIMSLNS
jgi:hypothetical protein